jgi:hypothetical protein
MTGLVPVIHAEASGVFADRKLPLDKRLLRD